MNKKFVIAVEEHKKNLLDKKEWELYFFIEALGGFVWNQPHPIRSINQANVMAQKCFGDKSEYYSALQDANIQQLSSFGIDPTSVKDRLNGDYWRWYSFWQKWHFSLTEEQLTQLHENAKAGLSVQQFLPQMQWNEVAGFPLM